MSIKLSLRDKFYIEYCAIVFARLPLQRPAKGCKGYKNGVTILHICMSSSLGL